MYRYFSSNNTNKLSPQEPGAWGNGEDRSSNNTNKLSPQEHSGLSYLERQSSNNTNKLSPQELAVRISTYDMVQIIQINLVLKNTTQKQ